MNAPTANIFSFEATSLLTSGVTNLPSNSRGDTERSAEMASGEMFSYLGKFIKTGKLKQP